MGCGIAAPQWRDAVPVRLDERAAITQRTLKRFDKPFSWSGCNCIRLARSQAAAMGHSVPPVPIFRTATGAKRALADKGFDSVTAMLDSYFVRLPSPAFAWVGDLVALPGSDGLEAVCLSDGCGNLFGWHEDTGFQRMSAILQSAPHMLGAWRL